LLVVVVGLLAMVQQSVQMSSSSMFMDTDNCWRNKDSRPNRNDMSSWAIVFSRRTSERVLLESGDFEQKSTEIIAGRVFRTGFLIGRPVVLVNTGKYSVNVASALQIALLKYQIRGVLYFGNAGDLTYVSDNIDSVVIPSKVAFTGIWDWLNLNEDEEGELLFGNFNEGANVRNELAGIKFKNVTLYTGKNEVSYPLYLETPEEWMRLAESIKKQLSGIALYVGPKVASSDIKVKNAAYASFLGKRFGFKIVDEDSATVALVSKSNDKPYIMFHGVSNSARGGTDPKGKESAAKSAYMVLKAFLKLLPQPRGCIHPYV